MKISFPQSDLNQITESIKSAMGGRALSEMVSFAIAGNSLNVVISKLGTSTLRFETKKDKNGGLALELAEEKIAFTHRAFKDEVKKKLVDVIVKAGGKVTA